MGKGWAEQNQACSVGWDGRKLHTHTHNSDIYITLARFSSDAATCQIPSMPPFPHFFLSGNSLSHISPTHLSLLLLPSPPTALNCTSLSAGLKAPAQHHFDSKSGGRRKKKEKRTAKGKSNRQKNEMTFWALTYHGSLFETGNIPSIIATHKTLFASGWSFNSRPPIKWMP